MHRTSHLLLTLIIIITPSTSFLIGAGAAVQLPQHQHHHGGGGGGCIPAERAALLSFKKGITNDSSNLLASWRGRDCCRWRGIRCSNQTGHVVELHLRNQNPDYDYFYGPCNDTKALIGEISPSLLSLKHLEHMDLSMSCLQGPDGHIPDFLFSMENLVYLDLSSIQFTGKVPSQLGNLTKLQYLEIGWVDYSGQAGYPGMHSTDITWLRKLPLLQYLSMSGVNLSGITDWPHTLNMVPSLRFVDLSDCSLHNANQSLPHLNLTKLEKLDLSWNRFDHSTASSWFWKVTSLKYLNLEDNNLFGQFPDTLGNMTYLKVLDFSSNWNQDMMVTRNLKNLCSLEILSLSDNEINGELAVLMERLPQCAWRKLQKLDLSYNNFTGTLPNLIEKFTSLNILELSNNSLSGSIPPGIVYLTCLTALDLSSNHFNGSVPSGIGALTNLVSLDLSNNNFSGNVPSEIDALTNLLSLDLSNNNFSGSVPSGIGALSNLVFLDLRINNFSGSVPSGIGALSNLVYLSLSTNNFNGGVPTEIGSLNNLISLDLSNNNFSGVIREEHFEGLKRLKEILLTSNNLKLVVDPDWIPPFSLESAVFTSCEMGPLFPDWLQRQLEITKLDISNTALSDKLPDWFWSTFSQAKYLDISNNQISGSLPAHLDGMAVEALWLTSNRFTGAIPSLPRNITFLDISNNTFSGTLPSDLGYSQLEILRMSSNQIGGHIPESICKLQVLFYLDLSNNILEGEIPQCSDMQGLQFLLLSNNSLSGKFPAFLQNRSSLLLLDLAWNKFSGRLPTWIGELRSLRFLLLHHNTFSDNIPVDITDLAYLQCLDLSANNFSGAIPWHLSNLTYMAELQEEFMPVDDLAKVAWGVFGGRHLREILSVITKGQQLVYGSTIAYFVSIDLSGNSLTGEIPTDITSHVSLMNLNLSSNQLSGQIPNKIGAMQSLVSLDLSKNKLFGEIPSSLASLSSLSYLNLSYNNLSGRIPSGRQLDTLNADNQSIMYIGNSGLCGPAVHKNCSGNETDIHGHLEGIKDEFDPMTFHFGLVLGFVVGLWVVFCALLFKKTWRIAYFQLFDKVYDRIYVFVVVKWASFSRNANAE